MLSLSLCYFLNQYGPYISIWPFSDLHQFLSFQCYLYKMLLVLLIISYWPIFLNYGLLISFFNFCLDFNCLRYLLLFGYRILNISVITYVYPKNCLLYLSLDVQVKILCLSLKFFVFVVYLCPPSFSYLFYKWPLYNLFATIIFNNYRYLH